MKKIFLIVVGLLVFWLVYYSYTANTKTTINELPVRYVARDYDYNVNDINEMFENHDVVFEGAVTEYNETTYINQESYFNEDGVMVERADPRLPFKIQVSKPYKGDVFGFQSINAIKDAGESYGKKDYILAKGDDIPEVNIPYLFFGKKQEDGSYLITGKNSNVLVAEVNRTFGLPKEFKLDSIEVK